jgi:hypothetical protein
MFDSTLAAVSIQRRAAAIAIFRKSHLEEVFTRQFPNDLRIAENRMIGFIRRVLDRSRVGLVTVETADTKSDRIRGLWQVANEIFRAEGIPIQATASDILYNSFAVPPLRNRDQLRRIARSIWPQLDNRESGRVALDAAVLGLHTQTERLFTINSPQP